MKITHACLLAHDVRGCLCLLKNAKIHYMQRTNTLSANRKFPNLDSKRNQLKDKNTMRHAVVAPESKIQN